jgi:hypothetical protein
MASRSERLAELQAALAELEARVATLRGAESALRGPHAARVARGRARLHNGHTWSSAGGDASAEQRIIVPSFWRQPIRAVVAWWRRSRRKDDGASRAS